MAAEHESSFNVQGSIASFDAGLAGVGSAADEVAGRDQTVAGSGCVPARRLSASSGMSWMLVLIGRLMLCMKRHAGSGVRPGNRVAASGSATSGS